MKKIAILNDLSGLGKCSLTAAIPVISVMGVQACPLPTAILSAQTGFPSYYYDDYTSHIEDIMTEWKKMGFCPDGIYTGFLAGEMQADRVMEFIRMFQSDETKILVDPVLGDNGTEYPIYSEALCSRMCRLAEKATIITPNLTEALLLLHGQEKASRIWDKIVNMEKDCYMEFVEETGKKLTDCFHTETVITGIDLPNREDAPQIGNLICKGGMTEWVSAPKDGGSYSGTGDLFASVLCAGMVKGTDISVSVKKAVRFLSKAIHDTVAEGTDRNEGVCFETYLPELRD